jgi:hypothetical protein
MDIKWFDICFIYLRVFFFLASEQASGIISIILVLSSLCSSYFIYIPPLVYSYTDFIPLYHLAALQCYKAVSPTYSSGLYGIPLKVSTTSRPLNISPKSAIYTPFPNFCFVTDENSLRVVVFIITNFCSVSAV